MVFEQDFSGPGDIGVRGYADDAGLHDVAGFEHGILLFEAMGIGTTKNKYTSNRHSQQADKNR
jgi:hypothetical protein